MTQSTNNRIGLEHCIYAARLVGSRGSEPYYAHELQKTLLPNQKLGQQRTMEQFSEALEIGANTGFFERVREVGFANYKLTGYKLTPKGRAFLKYYQPEDIGIPALQKKAYSMRKAA